jgi:hypothetical protein
MAMKKSIVLIALFMLSLTSFAKKTKEQNIPVEIKDAAKIVAEKGTVTYEAEIGNTDQLFDQSGNFIKKES